MAFCDILIERALFIIDVPHRFDPDELIHWRVEDEMYKAQKDQSLSNLLLEVYGDDPEHLAAMWSWAKSSDTLGRLYIHQPSSSNALDTPSVRSFHEQVQRDYSRFQISGTCSFLLCCLSTFAISHKFHH